jgi:putative DNA primase/helicase
MTFDAATIARARSVPVESEVAQRGICLKRNHKQLCGPCPLCGGTDRFNVDPRKNLWICRGCRTGGDVIALVRHLDGVSFAGAIETLTGEERKKLASGSPAAGPRDGGDRAAVLEERRQSKVAAALWARRRPIVGMLAERYLFWRGIACFPATIGYLPAHQAHPPAMIAAFGWAQEIEPGVLAAPQAVTGIHITRLTPEGQKVATQAKMMVGPSAGQPIVVAPPNDLLGLAICEGLEDALTVHEATGLGAWAAGAAGRMPALARLVPDYITCVTVFAHDDTGAGYARELAAAIHQRNRSRRDPLNAEIKIEGLS